MHKWLMVVVSMYGTSCSCWNWNSFSASSLALRTASSSNRFFWRSAFSASNCLCFYSEWKLPYMRIENKELFMPVTSCSCRNWRSFSSSSLAFCSAISCSLRRFLSAFSSSSFLSLCRKIGPCKYSKVGDEREICWGGGGGNIPLVLSGKGVPFLPRLLLFVQQSPLLSSCVAQLFLPQGVSISAT